MNQVDKLDEIAENVNRDVISNNELIQILQYKVLGFKYLDGFLNPREFCLKLAEGKRFIDKEEFIDHINGLIRNGEKELLKGIEIEDYRGEDIMCRDKEDTIKKILSNIVVVEDPGESHTLFAIAEAKNIKNIRTTGYRSNCDQIQLNGCSDVAIRIKDRFVTYNNESFSIACETIDDLKWCIMVGADNSGIKGRVTCTLKVWGKDFLLIDDLVKYSRYVPTIKRYCEILMKGQSM